MKALSNIDRIKYSTEEVMKLVKLYQYNGKESYSREVLDKDLDFIQSAIVVRDCVFIARWLKLDLTDNRMRLILKNDSNPRTNDEVILQNLKKVLTLFHKSKVGIDLTSNTPVAICSQIYEGVKKVVYDRKKITQYNNLLEEEVMVSKRDSVQEIFDVYADKLATEAYEKISLIANFYVDFMQVQPFGNDSDLIGILMVYALLYHEGFKIILYESFFEYFYQNYQAFQEAVVVANYNYESGYSHTEKLTDFIMNGLLENYKKLEKLVRDYEYDAKLNKGDNIENTISKLPQIFSKDDIREIHPYISDSTINRTLTRLRDEGKIAPTGTGRSAKWMKTSKDPERFNPLQLDIFAFSGEMNEN